MAQPVGERVETSPVGRAVITLLMAVLAVSVLLWNMPAGRPRDVVRPTPAHVLFPLGLDQDWALFAPDPRAFSVGVFARITYADGRERIRVPPHNGHLLAPYRSYRWQKYVERLRADEYSNLWEPTARWIARDAGPGVTKVVLVRTFQDAVTPGSHKQRPKQGQFAFYTLDLP
ncbi:MAG: hypothetical protein QOE99_3326 [Actinomycetota bacterium]|nr:hypothetical protein [Actinomycetota bacterium]